MALSVGPPFIIPFLLFGGFFLNSGSVPFYFKWLSYFSWFRYGFEGLLINQWGSVGEGDINCTRANVTCPSSGQVVLETLSFDKVKTFQSVVVWRLICVCVFFIFQNDFAFDFVALAMLIVIFRLVAYFCLYLRSRSKE